MAVASSRRKAPLTRRLAGRTTLALQVLKSESGMDDTHIPLLAKLAESASYKPGGYSKMSQRVKDLTPFLVLFHCVSLSWAQAVVVVLLLVLSRERSSHGSRFLYSAPENETCSTPGSFTWREDSHWEGEINKRALSRRRFSVPTFCGPPTPRSECSPSFLPLIPFSFLSNFCSVPRLMSW